MDYLSSRKEYLIKSWKTVRTSGECLAQVLLDYVSSLSFWFVYLNDHTVQTAPGCWRRNTRWMENIRACQSSVELHRRLEFYLGCCCGVSKTPPCVLMFSEKHHHQNMLFSSRRCPALGSLDLLFLLNTGLQLFVFVSVNIFDEQMLWLNNCPYMCMRFFRLISVYCSLLKCYKFFSGLCLSCAGPV